MAATLKTPKLHAQNGLVNGLYETYRVLPWPKISLTLLESIAKAPDHQVAKNGEIVYLLTSLFLSLFSPPQ